MEHNDEYPQISVAAKPGNPIRVTVEVTETTTYTFPNYKDRCSAHGQSLCILCARNPSTCADDYEGTPGCGLYAASGMHWDTCPNRIRS